MTINFLSRPFALPFPWASQFDDSLFHSWWWELMTENCCRNVIWRFYRSKCLMVSDCGSDRGWSEFNWFRSTTKWSSQCFDDKGIYNKKFMDEHSLFSFLVHDWGSFDDYHQLLGCDLQSYLIYSLFQTEVSSNFPQVDTPIPMHTHHNTPLVGS